MSIYLVTGPPGTGKTWFSVRTQFDALERGLWVAGNVEFTEGWERTLARANPFRWVRWRGRERAERRFRERCFISGDLGELLRLRLPACGRCNGCREGLPCRREERGVMVLDEAHLWLNARTWADDKDMRLALVKFFAEHRKLGWRIYLVTQQDTRIDAQVRSNAEFHIHLKNLRKYRALGVIPVFPFNLFVAITTWHGTGNDRAGVSAYRLTRLANLYDTMATSLHGVTHDHGRLIQLPESHEERARRRAAEAGQGDEGGAGGEPQAAAAATVESDRLLLDEGGGAPPWVVDAASGGHE